MIIGLCKVKIRDWYSFLFFSLWARYSILLQKLILQHLFLFLLLKRVFILEKKGYLRSERGVVERVLLEAIWNKFLTCFYVVAVRFSSPRWWVGRVQEERKHNMENCSISPLCEVCLECLVDLKLLLTSILKQGGKLEVKRAVLFLPVPKGRQPFSVCLLCWIAESREGNVFSEDFKRSTSLCLEMNYLRRNHQGQVYWRPFTSIFRA